VRRAAGGTARSPLNGGRRGRSRHQLVPGWASAGPGRGPGGLVGYFNLVMLAGIVWVFRAMRRGEYNETELERQLDNRGFFYRFFGPWMKVISRRWQMYPAGVIFGLASTPHRGPAPDDHRVAGL
jgi:hypothetical protein